MELLLGEIDGSCFANDCDFDLAWVFQVFLNRLGISLESWIAARSSICSGLTMIRILSPGGSHTIQRRR